MPQPTSPLRRLLLATAALGTATAALPSIVSQAWARFVQRLPTRTVELATFRFDPTTGQVNYEDTGREEYALIIDGLVENPLRLTYADLRVMQQTVRTEDFHCVEGWSVADLTWSGVLPSTLLEMARPLPQARAVQLHSLGTTRSAPSGQAHYVEGFPLRDVTDPALRYLLALDLDGEPLSHDRGAPCRLVTPFDLAYKSIKYVTRIELTERVRPGWWTLANPIYPIFAPVPRRRLREEPPPRKPWADLLASLQKLLRGVRNRLG